MLKPYLLLSLAALLPVIAAAILFLVDKYTIFKKLNYWVKQIIYGVIFGGLAIVGTHWGISFYGAQANARDASVIIAGLMFGWPAGVLAGLIGGIERFFGVYWFGIGSFTQIACSISTIIAGVVSALLRKFMFHDKKAGIVSGFFLGLIIEVFHLFMVFVTNAKDYKVAFQVINSCSLPMLLANSLSVVIAILIIHLLEKGKETFKKPDVKSLSHRIQFSLGLLVITAYSLSTIFLYAFQTEMAKQQTANLLDNAIVDVERDASAIIGDGSLPLDLVSLNEITSTKQVGETGYVAIFDSNKQILSLKDGLNKEGIESAFINSSKEENKTFTFVIDDEEYYCRYSTKDNYIYASIIPVVEADLSKNIAIYINTFLEIIIYGLVFIMMYFIVELMVNQRLNSMNTSLKKITEGDLDEVVDGGTTTEFNELSQGINETVTALKGYIDQANQRIDKELAFARSIQTSVLPNIFPAFPHRHEFDIHALMTTAKEVGGDIYDFYFSAHNRLNFLVADVSGKGIPAALFMMRAKTILKSLAETNIPINEVFIRGNDNLCDGNDAGMFVTAWQASIDLETGVLTFANAGHNPPLLKRANGKFEYLKSKANMVLAAMPNMKYIINEVKLEIGDALYLYTDGVTEAVNDQVEQFGEERLQNALNSKEFSSCKDICEFISSEVNAFVGEASQFDDITMLAFTYKGKQ